MNLRKHTPLPIINKEETLYWNGKLYEIHEDEDDILEWHCGHCDANKHRKLDIGTICGVCPDNDKDLNWKCFSENNTSRILVYKNES